MKFFIAHCGFYDPDLADGIYENHTNHFIAAESFEDAKEKLRANSLFKKKRMHIDGLQEIQAIDGYSLHLQLDKSLEGKTRLVNLRYGSRTPQNYESASNEAGLQ